MEKITIFLAYLFVFAFLGFSFLVFETTISFFSLWLQTFSTFLAFLINSINAFVVLFMIFFTIYKTMVFWKENKKSLGIFHGLLLIYIVFIMWTVWIF